ncbi:MAG: HAD hydrolase-like protein [Acetobacteraceae bacterium]
MTAVPGRGVAPTVLLDLDGTLSDSRPGIAGCFRFTLAELGHDPTAAGDLSWAVGPPIATSIGRLLAQYGDDRVEQGLAIYRARYSSVAIYECGVFPGVGDMLTALREAGAAMFIATSKRRDFAERVMDHLGLRGFVGAVYGAEPGGGLEEKHDLLAHILRAQGLDRARTVMVGDRLHDIHAAKANGLRSIGVLWGYGGADELAAAGADRVAASPDQVPALIGAA